MVSQDDRVTSRPFERGNGPRFGAGSESLLGAIFATNIEPKAMSFPPLVKRSPFGTPLLGGEFRLRVQPTDSAVPMSVLLKHRPTPRRPNSGKSPVPGPSKVPYPKNPWAVHGRGRTLHSRDPGPQNPICLRARILRVENGTWAHKNRYDCTILYPFSEVRTEAPVDL